MFRKWSENDPRATKGLSLRPIMFVYSMCLEVTQISRIVNFLGWVANKTETTHTHSRTTTDKIFHYFVFVFFLNIVSKGDSL